MKAGWMVALFAAGILAGCVGGEQGNPNLAAPKLVVAARADGDATVFVHSAFGERMYEWVRLSVDNETRVNRTQVFSIEEVVSPPAYLDASAEAGRDVYVLRARIELDAPHERASVSFLADDGTWSDARSYGLPFERLLERRTLR